MEKQIHLIITIVDQGRGEHIAAIFHKYNITQQLICHGHGTASSEILDYLGLDEPEKDIVIGIASNVSSHLVLKDLSTTMSYSIPGSGISFTLPISSMSLFSLKKINEQPTNIDISKEELHVNNEKKHELIVAITDTGVSDTIVTAAKLAGAKTGTVIKARQVLSEEVTKIFGITIQPEKKIVLFLVPSNEKKEIMTAVSTAVLKEDSEHGMVFSIPAHDVVGIMK